MLHLRADLCNCCCGYESIDTNGNLLALYYSMSKSKFTDRCSIVVV